MHHQPTKRRTGTPTVVPAPGKQPTRNELLVGLQAGDQANLQKGRKRLEEARLHKLLIGEQWAKR